MFKFGTPRTPVSFTFASDGTTGNISPSLMLPEKTKMKILIEVTAYTTDESGTTTSKLATETKEINCITGEKPDKIIPQIIAYEAPGAKQKYWYKGYARPKVVLKQGGYDYLFAPKIEGVDYEYRWRFYKGEDLLGVYKLNEYPSENTLDTTFRTKWCYAWWYMYPCGVDTVLNKGKTIRFDSLNDMALAKGGTYRIEIIRQPLSDQKPKTIVSSETASANATSTGEVVSTRKLKTSKSGPIAATYLLYSNTFSISQFTNLADKLALATNVAWKSAGSNLYRKNQSYNDIDFQAGQVGQLEIKGTSEPLDPFDSKRVESSTNTWQSQGSEFLDRKLKTEENVFKQNRATNYDIAKRYVISELKRMRTNAYNQDLIDRILALDDGDMIRMEFKNDKVQVLYNGQNLQTAQSELMYRLGEALNRKYTLSQNCYVVVSMCSYQSSFPCAGYPSCNWCSSWGVPYPCGCEWNWIYCPIWIPYPCSRVQCDDIWEQNKFPFIDSWYHNYSNNKYQGTKHPVKGGVEYWFPKKTPESMYDNFKNNTDKADARSLNFSFTPPN